MYSETEFDSKLPVARFANHVLTAGDVAFHVDRTANADSMEPEVLQLARAAALEFLIERQLVLDAVRSSPEWPGDSAIRMMQDAQDAALKNAGESLENFLASKHISEEFWRTDSAWEQGWRAYITKKFDDRLLQEFFDAHRSDFDGTRVHVSQILMALPGSESLDAVMERAKRIKQDLENGKVDFATAVREHSIAPSKETNGDLGWIERHWPMPETFSRAAFALEPGDYAEPFASRFGVHLVKCLEVDRGNGTAKDSRDELLKALAETEFREIADSVRASTRVEYEASFPHFEYR
jgi:parvulin-like peptidyl-prolyl isomerase